MYGPGTPLAAGHCQSQGSTHNGDSVLKFFQILLQMQIVTFNIDNKLQQAMIKNGKIG